MARRSATTAPAVRGTRPAAERHARTAATSSSQDILPHADGGRARARRRSATHLIAQAALETGWGTFAACRWRRAQPQPVRHQGRRQLERRERRAPTPRNSSTASRAHESTRLSRLRVAAESVADYVRADCATTRVTRARSAPAATCGPSRRRCSAAATPPIRTTPASWPRLPSGGCGNDCRRCDPFKSAAPTPITTQAVEDE